MNLDKNINDIVSIFNSFKENDDFYHEIMKEAYTTGKEDEARKITRARDEFKNNYKISKDTTELIKANFDKYIKIIESLNKKEKSNQNEYVTSNDTYNINSNEYNNNDTFDFSTNNTINNSESDSNMNEEKNENDLENNNLPDIEEHMKEQIDEPIIDESNYAFSSTVAKKNLEQELKSVNNQINIIKSNINNSEKLPSKKEYQQLFILESYRDKLNQRLENINLEESYGNNDKITTRDKQLSAINQKIDGNKEKLQSSKPKFVKVVIKKRIEKLQNKQGTIKARQRSIVNKDLLKYYKKSFKDSKSDSRDNAINKYYQDKKNMLQEKNDAILDNIDNNNNLISSIKNNFYKLKSLPTSARISYIEKIQNKEGKINGFKKLNKKISDKLYNKMQSSKEQALEQLKKLKGYLKENYQTSPYNPNMEDLINNLVPEQPVLEEVSSMHR